MSGFGGMAAGAGTALLGYGLSNLGGSAKAANNEIAPGLSKYTADQMSREARGRGMEALERYARAMESLTRDATGVGRANLAAFQGGASNLRGMAGRATGEVAGVYKDYGRAAEGVSMQNYADLLRQISAHQAIARARQGGTNSGQDMVAAGARAQAMQGLNANLADIGQRRAELYGGALERGRGRELGLGQDLLGAEQAARTNAFNLPAQYRNALIGTRFNTENSDLFLYPTQNLRLKMGGGSRNPDATNPGQEIGGQLAGLGGYIFGNGMDRYMDAPRVNDSYANMNGGSNRPR